MNDSLVIIPTYNEKENVSDIIDAVFAIKIPMDVLIIDDNSPDGTAQIVEKKQKELQNSDPVHTLHLIKREGKLGLGTAYITGFKYALSKGYQYIFEMDADFSHNPEDLIRLYNVCMRENYDVAIGSRYKTGVNVVNWPLSRVLLSVGASVYVRSITSMPIKDPTAGFICYRNSVLEKIDLDKVKFEGYAFQIEMKYLAWRSGFKIREVPIIFTDRVRGKSKMSISIMKEALWGVLNLRLSNYRKKLNQESEKPISDTKPVAS